MTQIYFCTSLSILHDVIIFLCPGGNAAGLSASLPIYCPSPTKNSNARCNIRNNNNDVYQFLVCSHKEPTTSSNRNEPSSILGDYNVYKYTDTIVFDIYAHITYTFIYYK